MRGSPFTAPTTAYAAVRNCVVEVPLPLTIPASDWLSMNVYVCVTSGPSLLPTHVPVASTVGGVVTTSGVPPPPPPPPLPLPLLASADGGSARVGEAMSAH